MLALLCSCSGEDLPPEETPPDGESPFELSSIDPPLPPDPPKPLNPEPLLPARATLAPCAPGWREVDDGEAVFCEPWPASGRASCPSDQAHFPGEPACTAIGAPCSSHEWSDALPADRRILYVRRGASANGDGSAAAPFARASEAIAAANAGDIVALGKGVFDEAITVKAGVTLWGACVAETVVRTSTPASARAAIIAAGDGSEVRNVTIRGALEGIFIGPGTSMHVESVVIDETRGIAGISVQGRATIRELAVRNTRAESDGGFGRGMNVIRGANAEVHRAVFEHNHDVGIFIGEASTVTLEDAAIIGTSPRVRDRLAGRALSVRDGSQLQLSRAVLEENHDTGIAVYDATTRLIMEDVVVRDTQPSVSSGWSGVGIFVFFGARVEGARVRLVSNHDSGLLATDPGTLARFSQLLVTDTVTAAEPPELGQGITVQMQARVEVSQGLLARNLVQGVRAELGASIDLQEVTIRETKSRIYDRVAGRAIDARDGAQITGGGLYFDHNREVGIYANGMGTEVNLSRVTVRDMLSQESDRGFGVCLSLTGGAHVELTDAIFERCRKHAIFAEGSTTTLAVSDLRVLDTQNDESVGFYGSALWIEDGARARVVKALFDHNRDVAIHGYTGAIIELEDIVLRETQPSSDLGTFGAGIWSRSGRLTIRRAEFDGNRHAAIAALDGAELDASDLRVTRTIQNAAERDFGYGLAVVTGAHGVVERAIFEGNMAAGVAVDDPESRLHLADTVITETRGTQPSGLAGRGLFVGFPAEVSLARAVIARNAEAGVLVFGSLRGEDVVVEDTLGRECARTLCPMEAAGTGVVAVGGSIELTRFRVRKSLLAGISLHDGGVADLHDGEISGNPIGVNVQSEAFDLRRLQDRVIYRDNDVPLDARALPAPEPIAPILNPTGG